MVTLQSDWIWSERQVVDTRMAAEFSGGVLRRCFARGVRDGQPHAGRCPGIGGGVGRVEHGVTGAASVALALVVFAKTGSTVWLSASFLFTQVPSALVAPLSGMMADRLDRKPPTITCDLLGAAVYLGMAVTGQPLLLIVLGSVAALLHAPFGPAARAAVPNLAGDADLSWANGTLAAASNVDSSAGLVVGGVLYAAVGEWAGVCRQRGAVRHLCRSDRGSPRAVPRQASRCHRLRCRQQQHLGRPALLWRNTTLLALTVIGAVTFTATEIAAVADLPLIHDFGVGGVGYGIMNVAWGSRRAGPRADRGPASSPRTPRPQLQWLVSWCSVSSSPL